MALQVYGVSSSVTGVSTLGQASACPSGEKDVGFIAGESLAQVTKIAVVKAGWKVISYVGSLFSLPGALASPSMCTPMSTSVECAPRTCEPLKGSFGKDCWPTRVEYVPGKGCEATVLCEKKFTYGLGESVTVQNVDGVLVVVENSSLEALAKLHPSPTVIKQQEAIIGGLKPGEVLTVTEDLQPVTLPPEKWVKNEAFAAYRRLALKTGGVMGHVTDPKGFSAVFEKMSAHIVRKTESAPFLDIALVIDTTTSMSPFIGKVKEDLEKLMKMIQAKKMGECRVGVVAFRDSGSSYVTKLVTEFTSDFDKAQKDVKDLSTAGGGDLPEAGLDGLYFAKEHLKWNEHAEKVTVMVSDDAFHPETVDGLMNEDSVMELYQDSGTEITIYPIYTGR